MSKHFGKSSGPWMWIGEVGSRRDIKGRIAGYRLGINQQEGIFLNLAVAWNTGGYSVLIGWYPNHQKVGCRVREEPTIVHRCWAAKLGDHLYGWPGLR